MSGQSQAEPPVADAGEFWQGLSNKERRDNYLTETLTDTLGFQLRQLRRQRGMSVEQLAELADCHPIDVRAVESGEIDKMDLDFLLQLAAVFEVGLIAKFVSYGDLARQNYMPTIHDQLPAQAMSAGTDETPKVAQSRSDASAVGEADAHKPCRHIGWSFKKHGRCCPLCNEVVLDFGD